MGRFKRKGVAVLLAGLMAGAAAPAFGVTWATQSSPLRAQYNGATYGEGYGTVVRIGSGTRTQVALRDRVSNGNGIYEQTQQFGDDHYSTLQSYRTQSSAWKDMATVEGYLPEYVASLDVRIRVCEDASLRPDICSVTRYYTL